MPDCDSQETTNLAIIPLSLSIFRDVSIIIYTEIENSLEHHDQDAYAAIDTQPFKL